MINMADWSKLPNDLLHMIVIELPKLRDCIAFGSVCPSWRSVFVQTRNHLLFKFFPKLVIPGETQESETRRCLQPSVGDDGYFTFNKDIQQLQPMLLHVPHDHYCCGSNLGWLVLVNDNFEMHLFNPLTGVKFDLPSPTTLPLAQPDYVNFSRYYILKAVISSDPITSTTTTTTTTTWVLIIYGGEPPCLALCKLGDKTWTPLEGPEPRYYMDAIYYKHRFYAVYDRGGCDIIDTDGPNVISFAKRLPRERLCMNSYLIESNGQLFIAIRTIMFDTPHRERGCYKTVAFRIYKLEEELDGNQEWRRVEEIGDSAFFVGYNTSFSLSASDYMGRCRPNSVYFTDDEIPHELNEEPIRHDIGVFNLEQNRVDLIFWVDSNPMRPPPFWFTPCPPS